MKTATIRVNGLKVAVPLRAADVPRDLVPMEGPAGEPVIELALEGSSLVVRAKFNGKNFRKMLKTIDEHGPDNVAVVLQGLLRPAEGGGYHARGGRLPGEREDAQGRAAQGRGAGVNRGGDNDQPGILPPRSPIHRGGPHRRDRGPPCHSLGVVPGSLAAGGIGRQGPPVSRVTTPWPRPAH